MITDAQHSHNKFSFIHSTTQQYDVFTHFGQLQESVFHLDYNM